MANMGSSFTQHRRAAGETTEWEDILRKKGIKPPSAYELELQAAAAEQAVQMAEAAASRVDPLATHGLRALDELEEEGGDFEDSRALDAYRAKRVAELKAAAARNRFGALLPLSRDDFVREVSEASKEAWVVVFLHQEHVADSLLLQRIMPLMAARHPSAKFLQIKADACIENYPDRNVPTLLLYHDGVLHSQVVGLAELGGQRVSDRTVEWVLARCGAVKTELEDDPRDARATFVRAAGRGGRSGAGAGDDDDDDDERR